MNQSIIMTAAVLLAVAGGAFFGDLSWLPAKEMGNLFISLLKMCVVPIAFLSITGAVIRLGGSAKKISAKAFALMISMSVAGVAVGLALMAAFGTADVGIFAKAMEAKAPSFWEFLLGCVSTNPFKAFVEGNMLQIITLSFFTGAAACCLEEREKISRIFDIAQNLCFKVTGFVLRLAPLGVFGLVYPLAAKSAGGLLAGYAAMAAALVLGSLLYVFCVEIPLLKISGAGVSFLKTVAGNDLLGAISGGATNYLAPRLAKLKAETDISAETLDYLLPLTAVLMRAGSCICVGIYTIFAAGIYDVTLTPEKIAVVLFLSVLALTCAPGIIGGTLMDCAIVWSAVGIPLEAVALLAGIDYLMDVLRTVLNIQGGEVVTAVTDKIS